MSKCCVLLYWQRYRTALKPNFALWYKEWNCRTFALSFSTEGVTYFPRAAIMLGIGPHSSWDYTASEPKIKAVIFGTSQQLSQLNSSAHNSSMPTKLVYSLPSSRSKWRSTQTCLLTSTLLLSYEHCTTCPLLTLDAARPWQNLSLAVTQCSTACSRQTLIGYSMCSRMF